MKRSTKIIALVLALVMVFLLIPITTVSAANIPGGTVLYLVPSANWNESNARFAAYFFGDGEAWVSMTKVAGESNLYEVTSPAGKNFTNVIFCRMNPSASANNWNNKWNQTSDLVYNGTSNCYTIKEGTWDKGGGTWSTYGSACAHKNVGAAATCTTAQLCLDCGDPVADALGHSYNSSHLCTRCNSQATFTVAGSGAHLGTEWDTGNTANDMTYADGVYTKVYTNVAAGSYALKVARDHDWGTAYPSADKAYTVSTSGSTVTVTLKGTTVTVKVEVPHTHSWSDATCTEAAKCACGETQGDVNPDAHKMVEGVCENGCGLDLRVTTAEELVAALANGGDVYLGADITISAKLDVVADTVIHGNDYTLTYTANGGRIIDVAVGTNGANLTINDLKIVCTSSWVERGINYNTSGTLTLNNVTIEAVAVNYAINLPSSSDNCTVVINDSHITGFIALNVWGENSNITINNSELYTQNNDIESGSCISVNFSTDAAANYTTVTVNGGKLISYFKNGELSNVVRNYATGSTVTISEETVVEGKIIDEHIVAMVAYPPYSDFYAYTSLQSAVNKCVSNHAEGTTNAKVVLLMDVALDELETPCNFEIDLNGYTLTVTNWTKTHNFVAGEVVAPTIDAQGYTVYTCSDCSATENRDFVDALTPVATADGDPYATLADALENGSEIVLLRDIELDAPIVVAKGASYTIDLNGYTLSYTSTNMGEAMITNKGTLVINDSVGTGVINYNYVGANDASYGKGNYTISNGGTLTVNGGKITIANLRQHAKYPIDNNSTTGDAILVINGGHLYNYNTSAIRMFCNSTTYKNSVTINGGLVEGYSAIWMQNPGKNTVHGALTITGGEIRTTAAAYVNGTATLKEVSSKLYVTIDGEGGAWAEDSLVSITGGTLNENVYLAENAPESITIGEGATFNGNIELPHVHSYDTVVTAPTVDSQGYTTYTCSCGDSYVADYVDPLEGVASIGDVKYATLEEAIAVGGEIVLLTDIGLTTNKGITIPAGAVIVLDLNGHVLGSSAIEAATSALIVNKGTLTIKDSVGGGKITTAAVNPDLQSIPGYASNTITNYGVLVLESGIIENTTNAGAAYAVDNSSNGVKATFTMNGGKLVATRCALRMFCNSAIYENNVVINGGTIEGGTRAIWIHLPGSDSTKAALGNLTINGGTLNGGSGQSLYVYTYGNNHTGTFVTITGGTFLNDVLFGGGTYKETQETVSITGGTFNGYLGRYLANDGWEDITGDEGYHLVDGVIGTHTWSDATCTAPKSCVCGETEGEALGHTWVDATCTAPKTCSVCSATEGDVLDHTYVDGFCSSCGAKEPHTHKDTGLDAKCDECGEYFVPASPFKLEMYQHSKGGTYYFKGSMSGYYFATTNMNSLTGAVDVYAEETEGGYYLYFLSGTTKNYLYVQISGSYTNIKYGTTKAVWAFNTTFGTFTTVVNGTTYYMGTYSSYETISASKFSYVTTSNVDVSQFVVRPVSLTDHVCADFTTKVTNPTCTAQGYTTQTCTACHVATKVDYVDALGHDLVEVEGLAPTCTATGYTAYKDCSRCTYVEGKETLEKVAHTYENCVCTGCDAVLPTLAVTDSFDFTTAEGLEAALASGKLGYTGTFRDNGDSHQFAADSSIQFVVPANTTVAITGHSTGYGVFSVYVNGEKNDMAGTLSFTVTEETKVVIVPDETATYSKAYLKGIALAEYVDRTITSDTTVTFGSEGNYKDSIVDFSGIQIGDNGGDNSQVKNGSFDLLLKAGSKVVIHGYPGYTSYQLNGGEEITDEYYTYLALEDTTLTVTPVNGNNYFYSIEVTLHTGVTLVEAKDATCTEAGHGTHYVCDCHDEPLTDKGEVAALGHTFVYGKCSVCGAADPDYVPYVNTLVVGDTNKIVVDGDTFNDYNLPIEWVAFVADEKAEYTFVGNNGALVFIFDAELNLLCGGTGKATLEAGTYLICIGNGVVGEINVAVTKTLLETPHEHVFSDATCTEPSKCECGETQVDALGHSYAFGECTRCGAVDPDYVEPQPPVEDPVEEPSIFQAIIDFFKMIIDFFKNLFKL